MRIRLNILRDNSAIEAAERHEEEMKKQRVKEKEKEKDKVKEKEKSIAERISEESKKADSPILKATLESKNQTELPTPPPSPTSSSTTVSGKNEASASSGPTSSSSSSSSSTSSSSSSSSASKKKASSTPHIRPLSDAKAIERGATFISEAFLFCVAGGLILFETVRSRRKELNRRDEVADRLASLEEEDAIWRRKVEALERRLDEAGIKRVKELPPVEPKICEASPGWFSRITKSFSKDAPAATGSTSGEIGVDAATGKSEAAIAATSTSSAKS